MNKPLAALIGAAAAAAPTTGAIAQAPAPAEKEAIWPACAAASTAEKADFKA